MTSNGDVTKIATQWEDLKSNDNTRQALFQQVFDMLQSSVAENQSLREQIENLQYHENNCLRDLRKLQEDSKLVQERISSAPFVLVLIDGDSAPFNDSYVKAGVDGGRRAARDLKAALESYLKEYSGYQPHWSIVVRNYIKMTGLVRTYTRAQIVSDPGTVHAFFRGFNEVHPLFEFIDGGNDREAVDTKVQKNFELFANNEHCKHIVLAASSDTGYICFLRPFEPSHGVNAAVTLVESTPFPSAFAETAAKFKTAKFPHVFRSAKIFAPVQATQQLPVLRWSSSYASATTQSPVVAAAPQAGQTPSQEAPERRVPDGQSTLLRIQLNAAGQRIDERLPARDPDILARVRDLKLCNRFYLSSCTFSDCTHRHDYRKLTSEEKVALRRVARFSKCTKGTRCMDNTCVAAHQCVYGDSCDWGGECKYPHITDRTVVEVV
ncbi:hypothetical protein LTR36_005762 [Oleoguttula mirabilis]|uniref:C3H1-type domain-containing protein n=1 Tax=Oleoguttula mirabilis TaxID=1507867 RepID=A0AAV9JDK6_9PEZI|nr:hypothetical protein LTR36_005762 [Oleoguttula mirabilis]